MLESVALMLFDLTFVGARATGKARKGCSAATVKLAIGNRAIFTRYQYTLDKELVMNRYFVSGLIGCTLIVFAGLPLQGIAASKAAKHEKEIKEAQATIAEFETKDPTLKEFFGTAYGYVVFPKVGKGGFIVGGAHGKGVVYKKQKVVGFAKISQATIGAEIGGQTYKELIFFENEPIYESFTKNAVTLAAQATAVAAKAGASANAKYNKGVAIFVTGEKGLMLEAAVGGQSFKFEPAM